MCTKGHRKDNKGNFKNGFILFMPESWVNWARSGRETFLEYSDMEPHLCISCFKKYNERI